jgi:hypothetical protein
MKPNCSGGTAQWGPAIADAIDTTGRLLQRNDPLLKGIIYDRPNVVEHAQAAIARDSLTERTQALGGNFFRIRSARRLAPAQVHPA